MKFQIVCAVKKDMQEILRTKKNLMYSGTLFLLSALFLVATKFVPTLLHKLLEEASHMVSDVKNVEMLVDTFFPSNLKANMGVLSSDIIVFYGLFLIFSTYNLVVKEIEEGKWLFPIESGYQPNVLNVSKGIAYGLVASFPCIIFYNIYYLIGQRYLNVDCLFVDALKNGFVLAFSVFFIVYISIIITPIFKKRIMSAMTMVVIIAIAPDVLGVFEFEKYFPTYLLTYLYQVKTEMQELIIPSIFTVTLAVVLTFVSGKKIKNINIV